MSIASLLSTSFQRSSLNFVSKTGTRIFPSFLHYFKQPPSPTTCPKVRIVSYKEMEKICEKNFDRRMERLFSERTGN